MKREAFFKEHLNQSLDVLFESKKGSYWSGLTDNYLRVMVPDQGENLKKYG